MTLRFNNFNSLLYQYSVPSGYLVAFSGGLDSGVLLDLMHEVAAQTKIPLRAIHIHHGLQSEADQWVLHCQQQCNVLEVPLKIIHLNIEPVKGESIEAVARERRYQSFESVLQKDELLLLAQHRDDQAETLMLQLLRGAGPEGLASMPAYRHFSVGALCRPLLDISREEIEEYAHKNQLNWIDDPSNDDIRYDRNYLRHNVMPLLKERWPSYSKTLSRSANLCADNNLLIRAQAKELLKQVQVKNLAWQYDGQPKYLIELKLLGQLSLPQCALLIREWLRQLQLAPPSKIQMQQLLMQMLDSSEQASPLVCWDDVEVRRYRNHLYAFKTPEIFDSSVESQWSLQEPHAISGMPGHLIATEMKGVGISKAKINDSPLTVSFRSVNKELSVDALNSETIQEYRIKPGTLKKIMQQSGIPPWERHRVVILSNNRGDLVAIVGWWLSPKFKVVTDEPGLNIEWISPLSGH